MLGVKHKTELNCSVFFCALKRKFKLDLVCLYRGDNMEIISDKELMLFMLMQIQYFLYIKSFSFQFLRFLLIIIPQTHQNETKK